MTSIKPFRAIIYNQEKIKELSRVTCPPYDIISNRQQEYYHNLSAHNFIHLLLGKDIAGEDKYRRAANYFRDWLKDKILIQDESPAIYFYSQQYWLRGEKKIRLGLLGLLHLADNNASIFCHEHTRLEPKEDRLRLLKAVKANLSPIFVLCYDKKCVIQHTYEQHIQGKPPFIDIVDEAKTVHKLWRLTSPEILANIQMKMSNEDIFIADGHHRYEVACAYRDEVKRRVGAITGKESFNYILTYFTNIKSQGLTILPIHRLVKLDSGLDLANLLLGLKNYFDLEELKDKAMFFFLMEKAGRTERLLGMYKDKRYWLLRLKNIKLLDKFICDKPKEYRTLGISILNYLILKNILGLNSDDKQNIVFSSNADDLIEAVNHNAKYIAFFLNAVKVGEVLSVAQTGNRMPPKSTYFYPKVLSGLVVNKFD